MTDTYYPEMDIAILFPIKVVFGAMLNDPLWLERAECVYEQDTKDQLTLLFNQLRVKQKVARADSEAGDRTTDLSSELDRLFKDLRDFSGGIPPEDTKEWMAYYRTATSLLDKITGLSERAMNVKAVSDFQSRVISIFDDILTPEQRTRAMEKLNE